VSVALSRTAQASEHVALNAFSMFEPGVLVFHHTTTPTLPNPYVPQAAGYSMRASRFGLGASSPALLPSMAATGDAPIALVVAAASDLAAAREQVYTNLQRSNLPSTMYYADIGAREL
jgi:hypothetical protein